MVKLFKVVAKKARMDDGFTVKDNYLENVLVKVVVVSLCF